MKKLSTLVLAGVMVANVAAPVFAENTTPVTKEEVKVEATKKVDEVKDKAKDLLTDAKETAKEAAQVAKEKAEELKQEAEKKAEEVKAKLDAKTEEVKKEAEKKVEEVKAELNKEELKVVVSPQKITLNGNEVTIYGYNINGENYFKLRDLAAVLKDTDNKFAVEYKDNKITLTKGADYTVLDTDQKAVKADAKAELTNDKVFLADKELDLKAYKLDGSNFYRLKDLGENLGFGVAYDEKTNTVLLTTKVEAKEEVKKEEVKTEEAKKEEVKAEENKSEDTKKEDKKEDKKVTLW